MPLSLNVSLPHLFLSFTLTLTCVPIFRHIVLVGPGFEGDDIGGAHVEDPKVHICIQQRRGKKSITTVSGLVPKLPAGTSLEKVVAVLKKVCISTHQHVSYFLF
jgi:hypothetical protein